MIRELCSLRYANATKRHLGDYEDENYNLDDNRDN